MYQLIRLNKHISFLPMCEYSMKYDIDKVKLIFF